MRPSTPLGRRPAAVIAIVACGLAIPAAQSLAAGPPGPGLRPTTELGPTGAGPNAIVVDAFENVYTANATAGTVTKISPGGTPTTLGTTGTKPTGIALDDEGNVYTANTGADTVTKITPTGTSTVLGTTGRQPIGITVDDDGNVYTTNYVDSTVTKITPAGTSTTLGATGLHPLGIVLDPAGNVYTANEGTNTVTKITPGGTASTLGTTGGWPQAIALDPAGNVYTANWNTRNVSKITPAGVSTILGRTGRRPIGITLDAAGNVYTTNNGSNSVSRITPSGRSKVVAITGRRPVGIAADPAYNLYTANALSNDVTKIFHDKGPNVVTLTTVRVGAPGNRPAWIIPFYNDVYATKASCEAALPGVRALVEQDADPAVQTVASTSCMAIGKVPYAYGVGETEITTAQWVTFLNTVDPLGSNRHHLWDASESSRVWPKYGSVNRDMTAPPGQRYYVSSPAWANKPYNTADFRRAARFVNSVQNGEILSRRTSTVTTAAGTPLRTTTYTVRLSKVTETGMYPLRNRRATRDSQTGFMVTSQDEWIKAAYFDPNGGGKFSYWDYPTNPGLYVNCPVDESGCAAGGQPAATTLDDQGNVTNAGTQPLASFAAVPGTAPDWCPPQFTTAQCAITPAGLPTAPYDGNVSTVGQALTRSPWGTLDQGGNTVEITDTIAPPPELGDPKIVWRRWHGGVVTATAYQMWLSAVGVTPQTVPGYGINPWRGFRIVTRGV